MFILPQTLEDILANGGNLKIDLGSQVYLPQTLIQLASVASSAGSKLTIKVGNGIILPQTMNEISITGNGNVTFEI